MCQNGILVNSGFIRRHGSFKEAIPTIINWLEEKEKIGDPQDQLQAAGLGLYPPALLG